MSGAPSPAQLATAAAAARNTSLTQTPEAAYSALNQVDANGNPVSLSTGFSIPNAAEPTSNQPFDQRIRRNAFNANIEHGYISTIGLAPGVSNTNTTFTCYFMFNPTEIDISYGFDDTVIGALNPIYNPGAVAAGVASQGIMLNQTISFTLMFDRTYEVWSGRTKIPPGNFEASGTVDPTHGAGPYIFGAQWDVWALERLVGMYGQWQGNGPSGPPAASLCQVVFSPWTSGINTSAAAGTPASYAYAFSGWMTSLEVEYVRFDTNMLPTRAAASLSFQQTYSLGQQGTTQPTTPASGGSTTPATTPAPLNEGTSLAHARSAS